MFPNNLQQWSVLVWFWHLPCRCQDVETPRAVLCPNKSALCLKKLHAACGFSLSLSVLVSCGHNFDEDGFLSFSHFCWPLATLPKHPAQIYAMPASPGAQAHGTHQCPKKKITSIGTSGSLDPSASSVILSYATPCTKRHRFEVSWHATVTRVGSWRLLRAQAGKAGSVSSPSSKQTPHGRASIASDTPACGFQVRSLFCLFCDCQCEVTSEYFEHFFHQSIHQIMLHYEPCCELTKHTRLVDISQSIAFAQQGESYKTSKWMYLTYSKSFNLLWFTQQLYNSFGDFLTWSTGSWVPWIIGQLSCVRFRPRLCLTSPWRWHLGHASWPSSVARGWQNVF